MANYTWSFSSLKEFSQCPKKYYEIRVAKNYTIKETEQMIYGTEVHKALEDYVKDGKPLPLNYQRFQSTVDALIEIPGTKYPEYEMGLLEDKSPCDFNDENRWVRGIVDLLIVDGDKAWVVDYKTGSNKYPDPKQLRLMALMTFAHFPEVQEVKGALMFIMHNSFTFEDYHRRDMEESWKNFETPLRRLEFSLESDLWQPVPTPLCGWCPVESCNYHKPRR
jgi:CRISPR/Cas system-associated exonuclease Cas4 (RecB family)